MTISKSAFAHRTFWTNFLLETQLESVLPYWRDEGSFLLKNRRSRWNKVHFKKATGLRSSFVVPVRSTDHTRNFSRNSMSVFEFLQLSRKSKWLVGCVGFFQIFSSWESHEISGRIGKLASTRSPRGFWWKLLENYKTSKAWSSPEVFYLPKLTDLDRKLSISDKPNVLKVNCFLLMEISFDLTIDILQISKSLDLPEIRFLFIGWPWAAIGKIETRQMTSPSKPFGGKQVRRWTVIIMGRKFCSNLTRF